MGFRSRARILFFIIATASAWGQTLDGGSADAASAGSPVPTPTPQRVEYPREASANPAKFVRNLAYDQKTIWSSPFKAKVEDLNWIIPLAGVTAGLINADAELSSRVNTTSSFSRHSSTISNAGVG